MLFPINYEHYSFLYVELLVCLYSNCKIPMQIYVKHSREKDLQPTVNETSLYWIYKLKRTFVNTTEAQSKARSFVRVD